MATVNPRVLLHKVERNLQDHGLGVVLRKMVAFTFRPVYERHRYRLYRIRLQNSELTDPSVIDGVEFRFLSPTDAEAIRQVEEMSEWLHRTVARRLSEGALCIAALERDSLIGFNLISFGKVYIPLIHQYRQFRAEEAWSEQIAVSKNERKRGLGANLRYRIFQELRTRGYRKLYGGALADNLPSLKLARRVGFQEFVDVTYTRLFAHRAWTYTRIKDEGNAITQ